MAPVFGEPLIHRTLRQLNERGAHDIALIAFDKGYEAHGVQVTEPTWTSMLDATGIGISWALWSKEQRTVVLFGDVFFTDFAADALFSMLPASEFDVCWYGRSGPGSKGYPWKELFGLSFYPQAQLNLMGHIERVRTIRQQHPEIKGGGWPIYRSLRGLNLWGYYPVTSGNFYEIDDDTTDFDEPEHYDAFVKRLNAS
jgi:hypothetical protein